MLPSALTNAGIDVKNFKGTYNFVYRVVKRFSAAFARKARSKHYLCLERFEMLLDAVNQTMLLCPDSKRKFLPWDSNEVCAEDLLPVVTKLFDLPGEGAKMGSVPDDSMFACGLKRPYTWFQNGYHTWFQNGYHTRFQKGYHTRFQNDSHTCFNKYYTWLPGAKVKAMMMKPNAPANPTKARPSTNKRTGMKQQMTTAKKGITHGFKTDITHGFKTDITHGFKTDIKRGFKTDITHGFKTYITHGFKMTLIHGFKTAITHGFKTDITHKHTHKHKHTQVQEDRGKAWTGKAYNCVKL